MVPKHITIELLADRGFVYTQLMAYLTELNWDWHICIRGNLNIYRSGRKKAHKARNIPVRRGRACFWYNIYLTKEQFGSVHLATAKPVGSQEHWLIVSNKPTTVSTLDAYALRFEIAENFLDDKSNSFQYRVIIHTVSICFESILLSLGCDYFIPCSSRLCGISAKETSLG